MSNVYILIVLIFKVFCFLAQFIIKSYIQFTTKKLKDKLAKAFAKSYYLLKESKRVFAKVRRL